MDIAKTFNESALKCLSKYRRVDMVNVHTGLQACVSHSGFVVPQEVMLSQSRGAKADRKSYQDLLEGMGLKIGVKLGTMVSASAA